ncbi:MAG: hypothetical protein GC185_05315 [Alphaproteobacteria bacterium]|nr:hypothetical protein [Alphaproteobacteria bacterium]
MTPLCPSDYAMVTVKLDQPAMKAPAAFQAIKEALALSAPDIDEKYGAVPLGMGDEYVVMIEKNLAQHLKNENHPNIIGVFSNPGIGSFGATELKKDSAGNDNDKTARTRLSDFGPAQSWSRRNKGPSF